MISIAAWMTARGLAESRLGYLGAVSSVVTLALAELVYLFERDEQGGGFGSFADAVMWSFSVVLAGQGDPVPERLGARVAMVAGFAFRRGGRCRAGGGDRAYLVDERRGRAQVDG